MRLSQDDLTCENMYANRHYRTTTGRYVVPLPVKPNTDSVLGSSLTGARLALSAVHSRMRRDDKLRNEYQRFMSEYHRQGHMRQMTETELNEDHPSAHYIPYHGIWQKSDTGLKLRVVFNASKPTSLGSCLNDILYAGPKLQNNLADVIARWRRHRVAFCADITMMFRQILVSPSDAHLQRIVWSPSPNETAKHFMLLTVTYGTACAPYLALRTLKQLCLDEGRLFPEAVKAVEEELYVDDFLSGADDECTARRRKEELIGLLSKGEFELKKWISNKPTLLDDISPENQLRPSWLQFRTEGLVNELGLAWDPLSDEFRFAPPR